MNRLTFARRLARAGRHAEALTEFLWLWEHSLAHDPAFAGVRASFLARDLRVLVSAYEPAREAFTDIYDRTQARIEAGVGDGRSWDDWITLANLLGRSTEPLAWVEAHRDSEGRLHGAPPKALDDFMEMLRVRKRDVEAGRLPLDIVAHARRQADGLVLLPAWQRHAMAEAVGMTSEEWEAFEGRCRDDGRKRLVWLYRATLAAGRRAEAEGVATTALDALNDDQTRLALFGTALEFGVVTPRHVGWLEEVRAWSVEEETRRLAEQYHEKWSSQADGDGP